MDTALPPMGMDPAEYTAAGLLFGLAGRRNTALITTTVAMLLEPDIALDMNEYGKAETEFNQVVYDVSYFRERQCEHVAEALDTYNKCRTKIWIRFVTSETSQDTAGKYTEDGKLRIDAERIMRLKDTVDAIGVAYMRNALMRQLGATQQHDIGKLRAMWIQSKTQRRLTARQQAVQKACSEFAEVLEKYDRRATHQSMYDRVRRKNKLRPIPENDE